MIRFLKSVTLLVIVLVISVMLFTFFNNPDSTPNIALEEPNDEYSTVAYYPCDIKSAEACEDVIVYMPNVGGWWVGEYIWD